MRPTILYIAIDSSLGGSTASLLNLIEGIKDYVNPIVLFPEHGVAYDVYVQHGIECHTFPFVKLYSLKENRLYSVWKHPWRWHCIKKLRFDYGCLRYVKKILVGMCASPYCALQFFEKKMHFFFIFNAFYRKLADLGVLFLHIPKIICTFAPAKVYHYG